MIIETLENKKLVAYTCPGVIVASYGPFTCGIKSNSAFINAEILEFVAQATFRSTLLKIKNLIICKKKNYFFQ